VKSFKSLPFLFFLSITCNATEFYLTTNALAGYFLMPDTIRGEREQYYDYWPSHIYSETADQQLLTVNNNSLQINVAELNRGTFGWSYGFGFFFDKIGFDMTLQHGFSLKEYSSSSSFHSRDTFYYSSIPHSYAIDAGFKKETASFDFFKTGLRVRYRHPLSEKLALILSIGPQFSIIAIDHSYKLSDVTREYYNSTGHVVYSEDIVDSYKNMRLFISSIETTPEAGVLYRFSKSAYANLSISFPFTPVKTMYVSNQNGHYSTDIILDNRFIMVHPELSLGVVFSLKRNEK
jgi:hypothetical protein